MNEARGPRYGGPETTALPAPRDAAEGRVWTALGLALALAVLRQLIYAGWMERDTLPGAGATLFVFAVFAALATVRRGRLSFDAASVGLTVFTLALAVSFSLWSYIGLRMVNSLLLLCSGMAALFSLAGQRRCDWRDARIVPEMIARSVRAVFTQIPAPFRALARLRGRGRRALGGAALALALCVPVLALVLALLGSADEVFLALERRVLAALRWEDAGNGFVAALRTLLFTLFFCSALFTLTLPPRAGKDRGTHAVSLPAAPLLALTAALDAVYLVFVFIQFRHLFGGAQTAAMAGGYALYARRGFFQLTLVAALNVGAALLAASAAARAGGRARAALRGLALLLIALTAVILVSAVWRMALYISVYGLSILRLLTLWGDAFIALCLGGAAWKLYRPRFRFFGLFLAAGLALWLAMSLGNPAGCVARYNVDAWLDGRIEEMDTFYLYTLGSDALPALERLEDAVGADFLGDGTEIPLGDLLPRVSREGSRAAEWTLSRQRAR